jgi:hypothetical protein
MRISILLLVAATLASCGWRDESDQIEVALTAVDWLQDPWFTGDIAVKPAAEGVREAVVEALIDHLGAQRYDEATRYCERDGPGTPGCVTTILSVRDLQVESRTAEITILAEYPPGEDHTAFFHLWTLLVRKVDGSWTVDRVIDEEVT